MMSDTLQIAADKIGFKNKKWDFDKAIEFFIFLLGIGSIIAIIILWS